MVVWAADYGAHRVMGFTDFDWQGLARRMADTSNRFLVDWDKIAPSSKPKWSANFGKVHAIAACTNAVLVASETELVALNAVDGNVRWRQPLPAPPVAWGLAVDNAGRVVVTLVNGGILCFGQEGPGAL